MNRDTIKVIGIAVTCFSLGTIIQIFIPNLFIVILLSVILLAIGILLLKC